MLRHIREVFSKRRNSTIGSQELCNVINENEEWPWGEWRQGKPITTRGIANILKKYNIRPKQESAGSFYHSKFFQDAWDRYLPVPSATSATEPTSKSRNNALPPEQSDLSNAINRNEWQIETASEATDYLGKMVDVALERPERQRAAPNGHAVDDAEAS